MSAAFLREAAALMRERATCVSTSAPAEPWRFLLAGDDDDPIGVVRGQVGNHSWTLAECDYSNDAEHIASWHPAVTLAVADWLDFIAPFADLPQPAFVTQHALAVAAAYLGHGP